jgi:hypothetical protein
MKRTLWTTLFSAVVMVGCGTDDPAPSCQTAMGHFYGAGCLYKDTSTQQTIGLDAMISRCEQTQRTAPSKTCSGKFDDWLRCNNEVPDKATTLADCDCSMEQMALLSCR